MDIERLAGTKLGNYEIESLLGRGGMGVVYKARQISLNRPIALKILPPTLSSDSSFVKRFHREAQAVAQLHHPNIVQVHDIAEEKGLHFFSMEYIEGRTLDKLLEEKGRLEVDEAIRIISQAALALEHAHTNGIIHRDIKPSNIILDKPGSVKVMDFGLARMTDDRSKLTQSGTLMGTLDYMSPEQCRGEELDERTDIYSLGVVLYETLTGKTPFDASNEAALIYKIINEEAPGVESLSPDLPRHASVVAHRATAKNKEDRYGGISEFLEDLRALRSTVSIKMVPEEDPSPSIAVLPFVNMSADPEQEYFCDGLAEELINALTQLEGLHVVARTSAFFFKGKDVKIRDVGRELNVETVLEGSVRKAGNRVRITAQLVKVDDGYHLWSEKYDRHMEDIFAIQDEISETILDRLKPKLLEKAKPELRKRQTVDLKAYNLYLKGRWFFNKQTGQGLKTAIECFEEAIEKAPDFALAYSGLADSYLMLPYYELVAPNEIYPKAREAALKALEIDDTVAEAHTSLAGIKGIYDWDWESAEKSFGTALELNPGYTTAHQWHAMQLTFRGRFDEAIAEMNQALELDPLSLYVNRDAGVMFFFAHKLDRAIEVLRRTLELDPNYGGAHFFLGLAYWLNSMHEEAIAEFEEERKVAGRLDLVLETWLGNIDALMGRTEEARQVLKKMMQRSRTDYVPSGFIAVLSFSLGEIDQGFEWLERAYKERDSFLCFLKVDPYYELFNLHSDSRYQEMLKKVGLDK
jgi:serine/threonine-protein kinase